MPPLTVWRMFSGYDQEKVPSRRPERLGHMAAYGILGCLVLTAAAAESVGWVMP